IGPTAVTQASGAWGRLAVARSNPFYGEASILDVHHVLDLTGDPIGGAWPHLYPSIAPLN
ncbi:hypothetical protein, partial [Microvirga sp. P5_D2]